MHDPVNRIVCLQGVAEQDGPCRHIREHSRQHVFSAWLQCWCIPPFRPQWTDTHILVITLYVLFSTFKSSALNRARKICWHIVEPAFYEGLCLWPYNCCTEHYWRSSAFLSPNSTYAQKRHLLIHDWTWKKGGRYKTKSFFTYAMR